MQHCSTVCCRLQSAAMTIERMQVSGRLRIQGGGLPGHNFVRPASLTVPTDFHHDVKLLKLTRLTLVRG